MVETRCLPHMDVFIIFYLSMEVLNACHPEPIRFAQGKLREGSGSTGAEILRCAQDDSQETGNVLSREVFSPNVWWGEGDVPLTFPCCAAYCIIRLFWICLHRRWLLFWMSDGRYLC